MKKLVTVMGFAIAAVGFNASFAQDRDHRDDDRRKYRDRDHRDGDRRDDGDVNVSGEVEFEIGDTKVRIGSSRDYDGNDHRSLERRLRNLERAVGFLLDNQGFRGHRRAEWECTLETSFHGIYVARGDSEASAKVAVVNQCYSRVRTYFHCDSDDVKCFELRR